MNLLGNPAIAAYIEMDPVISSSRMKDSGAFVSAVVAYANTNGVTAAARNFDLKPAAINAAQTFWAAYLADLALNTGTLPPLGDNVEPDGLGIPDAGGT